MQPKEEIEKRLNENKRFESEALDDGRGEDALHRRQLVNLLKWVLED